jgi:glucose dehydrogenase
VERISALHTLAARSGQLADAERVMIGAVIAGGGLWLLLLGGTPYYILSGTAYVVSGVLLWRRRQAGAWLAVALLAATLAWAVWDAGLDYWAVSARLFLPAGLALMALLATLRFPANKSWRVAAHTTGVLGLLIGIQFAFAFVPHRAVDGPLSRPLVSVEHSDESSNQ